MPVNKSMMYNFLLSRFISSNPYRRNTQLCSLQQNAFFLISSFSSKSNAESQPQINLEKEDDPFTVSYLINSCGLSRKIAVQASKEFCLKNPDTADSVLSLLRSYGFSESQVSTIVKRRPRILASKPEETLLPKFKFLQSMGVSSACLPELLVCNPRLLKRSLSQFLIPRYSMLRSVLSNDEEVIKALKCGARSWSSDVGEDIVPNIKLLRELGVPQRSISSLVTNFPDVAVKKHTKFAEAVKSVKEMGFDPAKSWFVVALQVLAKISQSEWESKLKAFERWGWSRNVTLSAFKKYPNCMLSSKKKIDKIMEFLVDEMGFSALAIAEIPMVFTFSLEKRIIPRCLLLRTLKSEGLVKNDLHLSSFLFLSNKSFVNSYVARFQDLHAAQIWPSNYIQP